MRGSEGLRPAAGGKAGWVGALCGTAACDCFPETLSKPVIWAKPSFMIPKGHPAVIWCQGPHQAVEYQLLFEGGLSALGRPKSPGSVNRAKFSVQAMNSNTAGQYQCLYRSGERWSQPSDPLDLVVTGDSPTLQLQSHALGLNPGEGYPLLLLSCVSQASIGYWSLSWR